MEDIKKDIETLYSKTNHLDTRMTKIEATRPFLEDMIERDINAHEKLAATLQEVQMSMVNLNAEMASMKQEFTEANEKTNTELVKVSTKVTMIEEKGKFDIQLFIKSNWPWIMVLLGFGLYTISKFVRF